MIHLPILRAGKPYESINKNDLTDFRTGEKLGELSLANPGLIARDMAKVEENQRILGEIPIAELIKICERAAKPFLDGELPLADGTQTAEDYVNQVSATTGMPKVMARRNMFKIAGALEHSAAVLEGLTRGESLDKLHLNFRRETPVLGAILPNNSPGVHTLWLPALAMQVPVCLKPGSREPWSPYRIIQAFIQEGMPPEAFGYYPTDPNGTREILMRAGKSMFFGDKKTVEAWKGENRVQLHGPGWSKVIVGPDKVDVSDQWVDLMASSIAANGGRSCINASGIWTAGKGRELAEKVAQKLAAIKAPTSMDDPEAELSAFTAPKMAEMISRQIDGHLAGGGAEDLTAKYRDGDRVATTEGGTFLLPTLIWCDDPDHPLARAEYMFPYASVVETDDLAGTIGPTLVATLLSEDESVIDQFLAHDHVDRINVGPVPTFKIRWDQPHEGNLFELLYKQRAVQYAAFVA